MVHGNRSRRHKTAEEDCWPFVITTGSPIIGRRTPDKVAVVDLASERRFTYAQFDARISRLAAICANARRSRAATASRCWR